jgi:PRC-barrel domain
LKRSCTGAALVFTAVLAGCHTLSGAQHRAGGAQPTAREGAASASSNEPQSEPAQQGNASRRQEPPPTIEANQPAGADAVVVLPCLPLDDKTPRVKLKPKSVARRQAPPPSPPTAPVPETSPPDGIIDARVEPLPVSVMSILGKKVQSPKGDDLGRVVDVLADSTGRVRVAIIDFGGFLGVGDRRIAVDWPLLRFNPDRRDPSLLLSLSRDKLKAAPEYKDNPRPQTLTLPPTGAAPAANEPTK